MQLTEDFIKGAIATKDGSFFADDRLFFSITRGMARYIYDISNDTGPAAFICISKDQELLFDQAVVPQLTILSDKRVHLLSVYKKKIEEEFTCRFIKETQDDSPLTENELVMAKQLAKEQKYLGQSLKQSSLLVIEDSHFHKMIQGSYPKDYLYFKIIDRLSPALKYRISHEAKALKEAERLLSSGEELLSENTLDILRIIQNSDATHFTVLTENDQRPHTVHRYILCKKLISETQMVDEIKEITYRRKPIYVKQEQEQIQAKLM